jgi:hypothetical protein
LVVLKFENIAHVKSFVFNEDTFSFLLVTKEVYNVHFLSGNQIYILDSVFGARQTYVLILPVSCASFYGFGEVLDL